MSFGRDFANAAALRSSAPERDDEERYLEEAIELDPIDGEGSDDSESTELNIGEEFEDLLTDDNGDDEPIELDLGSLIDSTGPVADEDEDGIDLGADSELGLDLPATLLPDDGVDGIDDQDIVVDESKFPAFEFDDGSEGIATERDLALSSALDEAQLPLAPAQYRIERLNSSIEACSALTARGKNIVLASSDILWFRAEENTPVRLAVDGSALSDLALLGANQDIVLAATHAGHLFRRARFASQADQLAHFREFQTPVTRVRTPVSFSAALDPEGQRLFVVTQDGLALEVLDAGERFSRIMLPGRVSAIARESPLALVSGERGPWLVPLIRPEHALSLSGPARATARASSPLLATAGSAIALAEPGRAVVISRNAGQSFKIVPGTANTTALTGADGEPHATRFYAAIYREARDETDVIVIDPERDDAHIVAHIACPPEAARTASDALDRGEWARVSRLVWHAASATLWAVGGFGVLTLTRASA